MYDMSHSFRKSNLHKLFSAAKNVSYQEASLDPQKLASKSLCLCACFPRKRANINFFGGRSTRENTTPDPQRSRFNQKSLCASFLRKIANTKNLEGPKTDPRNGARGSRCDQNAQLDSESPKIGTRAPGEPPRPQFWGSKNPGRPAENWQKKFSFCAFSPL